MEALVDLLTRDEGKTLEFKRDLSSPEKVLRTLVAFANGAGGTLVIGVSDGKHEVVGLPDPRLEEERLANLISSGIEPQLSPEISLVAWRRTHVLIVQSHPGGGRPYRLKRLGVPHGVYVRIGSTNRVADPAQVDELKRVVLRRTFDEESVGGTNSEAIDFRVASELFAAAGRTLANTDLATLGMVVKEGARTVATTGGILAFGRDRMKWFPDAYLKAGCFAGKDRTKIADSAEFNTCLPLLAEEGLRFVQRHLRQSIRVDALKNKMASELPEVALREAVVNALVHADYSRRGTPLRLSVFDDRVEIENPGGLPPGLCLEDLRRGVSKLRNPVIARVFRELGLVEQWGSGVQRMFSACTTAGLPPPLLEETGSGFRVTLFRHSIAPPQLTNATDARALAFIGANPGRTTAEVARDLGLTSRATRTRLAQLVAHGLLVVVGSSPRDPKRAYHIPTRPPL